MAYRTAGIFIALAIAGVACTQPANDGAAANDDALTMGELPIVIPDATVVAGSFDQAIDHTPGTTVTGAFKQRFWYSTAFATGPASPVILHICGEYECDATYLQRLADTAKSLHAVAVTLEHRYYGASLPFGDRPTNDQYQYLTISQALDDIAAFVSYAKTPALGWQGGWIAAGGSYAGMLAAFVRLKHPEAIAGAWASSAPVDMQQSFYGYDAVTSFSLGKECGDSLRLALTEVAPTLADPTAGPALLDEIFGTDPDTQQWLKGLTPEQQAGMIEGSFSGSAMTFAQEGTGGPQLCSALAQHAAHPIDGMVGLFNPPLAGDDDDNATTTAPAPSNGGTPDALGPGGAQVVASMSIAAKEAAADPTPDPPPPPPLSPDQIAGQSWNWQSCTEMGFFETSNPDTANSIMQPSGPTDVDEQVAWCLRRTGKPINVNASRLAYFDPIVNGQASNILFVNGTFDPWSSLSFNDPAHPPPGTQVYVIAEGHHHEELESLTPNSLLGEFEAHKMLHDLALQWLAPPTPAPAP